MAKCKYNGCNEVVKGKAKYCSPKCKQATYRNKRNTESVTDKPESVTVTSDWHTPKGVAIRKSLLKQLDEIPDIPEQGVTKQPITDMAGLRKHWTGPKAHDPNVQAIWDGRNAQGQAAGYSSQATEQDYPQTQRPHHSPEPALAGQTQEVE